MRRKLKFLAAIRSRETQQSTKTDTAGSVSVTGNFNSCFGIVGKVGGNYARYQVLGTDIDPSMHSFVGGPHFSSRNVARATPFARLLVGAAFKPVVMAILRYRGRGLPVAFSRRVRNDHNRGP